MTKVVPIVLTEYQAEIYSTESRIAIPTGPAGVGSTYGLILKALKEANEGKIVTFVQGSESRLGSIAGVVEEAARVSIPFGGKLSVLSRIISVGEGKIKFVGNDIDMIRLKGLSTDLVIFDHIRNEALLNYFLMTAKQVIIGMHFSDVMESTKDHWLQKSGLVECDESGTPIKFADYVHHIKCKQESGFKFKGHNEYMESFNRHQCYDMQKLTVSDFADWKS